MCHHTPWKQELGRSIRISTCKGYEVGSLNAGQPAFIFARRPGGGFRLRPGRASTPGRDSSDDGDIGIRSCLSSREILAAIKVVAILATMTKDDSFHLYDLKVTVLAPEDDSKIYCGAQPGDHFVLQGEMLHLPPGQGFSIYSLCTCPGSQQAVLWVC